MPRWRQKAVCRGNSGWCVRLPGSPVWKMPAFQTSPALSANIPPSHPFSLCRSHFLNLLLLLLVLRFFPPRMLCFPFRGSPSQFAQKKKKKSLIVVLTPLTKSRHGKNRPPISDFLTFPSDRKVGLFYKYIWNDCTWCCLCPTNQNGGSRLLKCQELNELSFIMWMFI